MNEIANNDMNEYWNGDRGHQWVHFQKQIEASLKHFGHQAMEKATISMGENVIDIGCGCGDTTFDLAHRTGPIGYVQGVDISEPLLARARARAVSSVQNNITFKCCDAQIHRFKPSTADVAFSRFGVMFFEEPITAFSNIRRALKPDGRLAFICWQQAEKNEWINLPLDIVKKHIYIPTPPEPGQPGPFAFGDSDRIREILSEASFQAVSIENYRSPICVGANLDEAVEFLTNMGPAGGAMSQPEVDDADKSQISAELRDELTAYRSDEAINLGAAAWIVTARNP